MELDISEMNFANVSIKCNNESEAIYIESKINPDFRIIINLDNHGFMCIYPAKNVKVETNRTKLGKDIAKWYLLSHVME